MRQPRRLAVVLVLLAMMAACGDDDDDASAATSGNADTRAFCDAWSSAMDRRPMLGLLWNPDGTHVGDGDTG